MIPSVAGIRSLCFLALTVFAGCSDRAGAGGSDQVAEARAPHPAFNAEEAYGFLKQQVAFGPRIPGTEAHEKQLQWMLAYLKPRADTVVEQHFTHVTRSGKDLGQMTNLFVRFRPQAQDRILLVTHWDTRPTSDNAQNPADRARPVPGANDAASGTAVMMELADMLKKQPPNIGVDLLFVDGEDYGPGSEDMYLGARYFASHLPAGYRPFYGILLDMIGDRDLRLPVEPNSQQLAPEVVQRVWSVAKDIGYGDIFVNSPGEFPIEDDHLPLNRAGIRTIDIIDFDYGPGNRYWHSPQDLPENTSAESLRVIGDVMAELIYRGG